MHSSIQGSATAAISATVSLLGAMLSLMLSASTNAAQPQQTQKKPANLFASETTLEVKITAPWRDFMRKKNTSPRYPAKLEVTDASGSTASLDLSIEPRGITRLKVCKFPPVKLIFDKEAIKGTPFRGNKSLKLVTHCGDGERWERYPVREMLAYHIYNRITARSFRVRALSITYVDSGNQSSDGPHFAFLIEDDSALAKRNELEKLDIPKMRLSQLDSLESNRFSLFQFLIGNTDWSVLNGPSSGRCCHNSELIGPKTQASVYAVPYDFDSSGLVDAHYAAPNDALRIQNNRERLYRGFCTFQSTLETARQELLQQEAQILQLARSEDRLDAKSREVTIDYLARGFEILRDDQRFARDITAKCRK